MLKFSDEEGSRDELWFRARVAEAAETYGVFPFGVMNHAGMTYGKPQTPTDPALYMSEPTSLVTWTLTSEWKFPYCVVDVGANVGAFTYLASLFSSDVRAYEPCASTFARLNANVEKYINTDTTTVQTHRLAAGATSGQTVYMNAHETGLSGDSFSSREKPEGVTEEVKTISLADIIADTPQQRIDYLKVDCEGAEYDFLLGQDLSNVGYVEVELHGDSEDLKETLLKHLETTHAAGGIRTQKHESGLKPLTYLKGVNLKLNNACHRLSFENLVPLRSAHLREQLGDFRYEMRWGNSPEVPMFTYLLPYSWEYYNQNLRESTNYEERLTGAGDPND